MLEFFKAQAEKAVEDDFEVSRGQTVNREEALDFLGREGGVDWGCRDQWGLDVFGGIPIF